MPSRSILANARLRLLLAALLALTAAPSFAGVNRWTPFGPTGGPIDDVLIDPRVSSRMRIASRGAVYKSEDAGASWQHWGTGLEGQVTRFLAFDPGQPDVLYAGTDRSPLGDSGPAVFRSEDGGAHWARVLNRNDYFSLYSLAVAPGPPGAPGVVFVGTDIRLFRSVDGGASFQPVISLSSVDAFHAVAPDPQTPGTVYCASQNRRRKSTDFGATWTDLDENPGSFRPSMSDLVVAPGSPQTLYETGGAASFGTTWRSHDGGATWEGPFPFGGDVLAVDPQDPETVYLGNLRGLFVSRDGGETFILATQGIPSLSIEVSSSYGVKAIAIDPSRAGYALAGTAQGLFATTDRGGTWQAPAQRGLIANQISDFRIDPFDPAHWILRNMGSYLATRDGGRTFAPFAAPLSTFRIYALEFDPYRRHRMWALAADGTSYGLYVSDDGGVAWRRVGDAPTSGSRLLAPAPRVLLSAGNGILRSADAGRTWRRVQSGAIGNPDSDDAYFLNFQSLLQDPRNVRTVYALGQATRPHLGGSFFAIFRSDDVGRTWRLWNTRGQAVGFDPFRPRTVHVAQGNTLLVTRDGGATFQTVGSFGLQGYPWVLDLIFDRDRRDVLYAGTYADGILASRDGGASWEPLNDGFPDPVRGAVTALVQDPARVRRFYAAPGSGGLYRADFAGGPP